MTIVLNGTTGITNDGGYTGDGVVFADTTPANTLVTTTGGNVGIGTSSPGASLHVAGTIASSVTGSGVLAGIQSDFAVIHLNGSAATGGIIDFSVSGTDSKGRILYNNNDNYMSFATNNAERARIDSSGNLLVGTTSAGTYGGTTAALDVVRATASQAAASFKNITAGTQTVSIWNADTGGTRYFIEFSDGSTRTTRGSITSNGTTTSYNTSSDYRLKENIQPMQNALARVTALKPVTYKWKSNGSDGEGFIAHELAEVMPDCVTGEKDAVDAEGNPRYQGIDTSFLVATLTAAIQEQQAIITTLTARVAALEGTQP
jgi:hypothetical protein